VDPVRLLLGSRTGSILDSTGGDLLHLRLLPRDKLLSLLRSTGTPRIYAYSRPDNRPGIYQRHVLLPRACA
jgi:hypothetical protein